MREQFVYVQVRLSDERRRGTDHRAVNCWLPVQGMFGGCRNQATHRRKFINVLLRNSTLIDGFSTIHPSAQARQNLSRHTISAGSLSTRVHFEPIQERLIIRPHSKWPWLKVHVLATIPKTRSSHDSKRANICAVARTRFVLGDCISVAEAGHPQWQHPGEVPVHHLLLE